MIELEAIGAKRYGTQEQCSQKLFENGRNILRYFTHKRHLSFQGLISASQKK
jgi:hypothetical protein